MLEWFLKNSLSECANTEQIEQEVLRERWVRIFQPSDDSNPGRLDGKRERFLCVMPSPKARLIWLINGNSGVTISTKARVEPWTSTKTFCFLILSKDEWTFNWASFKFSTPLFSVSCVSHLLVYSHLHSMHSKSFGSFDIIATFGIITLSLLAGEDSNLGAKNFFTTSNTNQKPNPLIQDIARQGQRGRGLCQPSHWARTRQDVVNEILRQLIWSKISIRLNCIEVNFFLNCSSEAEDTSSKHRRQWLLSFSLSVSPSVSL